MPPKIKPSTLPPERFSNPWKIPRKELIYDTDERPDGVEANAKRVSYPWPLDWHKFFTHIRPGKGTVNIMVLLLLEKLKTECERRGITDMSHQEEFERLVANCRITEVGQ